VSATKTRHHLTGHAFLLGALVCFAMFSWYPMVRGFIMSFQRTRRGETSWVGWQNFERIVNDPSFARAWQNTLTFTLLALLLGYALPFVIAILLNELRHARGYLRALVYLPVMLPPASALFLFKYAYQPGEGGLFNFILNSLGLPMSNWTQSTTMTLPSLVIASTWMNMGGAILIYLAALQGIPGELYEAAELDGAGPWRRLVDVTLPLLRPTTLFVAVIVTTSLFQIFAEPYVMTAGGPLGATTSVALLMYQQGFRWWSMGNAAAIAFMLFGMVLAASGLQLALRRWTQR